MPTPHKNETTQITFKLDEEWYRPLREEADGQGISPNIAAREHLIRVLGGERSELATVVELLTRLCSEVAELRELVAAVHAARSAEASLPGDELRELREFRLDFLTGLAAVLAELRPQATADEIAAWIKQNLLRKAA